VNGTLLKPAPRNRVSSLLIGWILCLIEILQQECHLPIPICELPRPRGVAGGAGARKARKVFRGSHQWCLIGETELSGRTRP